jgi:hypothetical protein
MLTFKIRIRTYGDQETNGFQVQVHLLLCPQRPKKLIGFTWQLVERAEIGFLTCRGGVEGEGQLEKSSNFFF